MKYFKFVAALFLLFLFGCTGGKTSAPADTKHTFDGLVIVLDPGHGGIDHGATSVTGAKEDQLNLQVCLLVSDQLQKAGAVVVMTRESVEVDYSGDGETRKRRDMANRARLIEASKASAVISVHMNKYLNGKFFGPQTYFRKGDQLCRQLASDIQDQLLDKLPSYKKYRVIEGNFFILNVSEVPSVLVECGFLSNRADDKRLRDCSYQQKVAECIFMGICDYFGVVYD